MFTGIIEEIGLVEAVHSRGGNIVFAIRAPKSSNELAIHDSVAINGACHTAIKVGGGVFKVESVEETLKKTAMGSLKSGARVNLELPMKLNHRLGGHLVLGHVDTTGIIVEVQERDNSWMYFIEYPAEFQKYVIPVGSICVDGVSLTVAECDGDRFGVSIIPFTKEHTIIGEYEVGRRVNLEFDLVGKYIENMLAVRGSDSPARPQLSIERLKDLGY
jgi:riboflavin synthase